jgi:hypothetical protein
LDAGCGEGYYTYRISDVGYETWDLTFQNMRSIR